MGSIKIKHASTSKARERQINALYARIFKEKQLPDNEDMRVYENMKMINVYELLESGEVKRKKNIEKESLSNSNRNIKSVLLLTILFSILFLILINV